MCTLTMLSASAKGSILIRPTETVPRAEFGEGTVVTTITNVLSHLPFHRRLPSLGAREKLMSCQGLWRRHL